MLAGRNLVSLVVGVIVLQFYSSYANFRPGWNSISPHIQDKQEYSSRFINFNRRNQTFFSKNQQENQEVISFEINYSTYYYPPVTSIWDWPHLFNLFTQIWEFGKEFFWEESISASLEGRKIVAAASFWVPKKTWQNWTSVTDVPDSPSFSPIFETITEKKEKKSLKVVVWLHGTSGIYPRCAPANNPETEIQNIPLFKIFIQNGWAVFAPQYIGLSEVKNYSLPSSSLVVHPYLFARSFISSLQDAFFAFQICVTKRARDGRFVDDSFYSCSFFAEEGLRFLAEFSPFYEVNFSIYGFSEGGFGALWFWTSSTLTSPLRYINQMDFDAFSSRRLGQQTAYRAPISSIVAVSSPIDLKKSFLNSRESMAGKLLTLFVIYSLALLEPNFFRVDDVIKRNSISFTDIIHTACIDSEEDFHWSFFPYFGFFLLPAEAWFHSNWEALPSWSAFLLENSVPFLDSQDVSFLTSFWSSFVPIRHLNFQDQDEKFETNYFSSSSFFQPFLDSTYPLLLIHGQEDELVGVEDVQEWVKRTKKVLPKTTPFRLSIWRHANHSSVLNTSSGEALAWMEYFWSQ